MLQNAIDNGYHDKASKNDFLRHKFWTSLRSEKLKGQTRYKYDSITKYDKLLLEIRRVEKELSISTRADERKGVVHQHGMSTKSDLQVLEQKMEDMKKTLDGKLDKLFNQILAKLDTRKKTGSNNNYHGRWSRGNNKRGRGNYTGNISQVRGHSYDRRFQGRRQNRGGYYSNNSDKPPNM